MLAAVSKVGESWEATLCRHVVHVKDQALGATFEVAKGCCHLIGDCWRPALACAIFVAPATLDVYWTAAVATAAMVSMVLDAKLFGIGGSALAAGRAHVEEDNTNM